MKKSNSIRWMAVFATAGLLLGATCSRADDLLILSGRGQLHPGWVTGGWGGVQVETVDKDGHVPGTGYVTSRLDDKSAAWSGMSFHVAPGTDVQAAAIPLTAEMISSGFVEMFLNCGKGVAGNPNGAASVKVVLTFVTKDGKTVSGSFEELPPLDSDAASWEQIQVPLSKVISKLPDPTAVVGLSGVNIQYMDAPTCEVRVSDCALKAK